MLLGSKPVGDMSEAELLDAIAELRSNREALRTEAIARKAERDAKGVPEPKAPKAPRTPKVDPLAADMLAFLRGEKDI